MATYVIPNMTGGADNMLIGIALAVPQIIPAILFMVWCFVFFSGIATQQLRNGYSDFPAWAFVASILTTFLALLFSIKEGLMNAPIFAFVVSFTILCAIYFFFTRGRFEQ